MYLQLVRECRGHSGLVLGPSLGPCLQENAPQQGQATNVLPGLRCALDQRVQAGVH